MENQPKNRLAGAAAVVMTMLVLSRITGFLRSVLIPDRFQVGAVGDAFNTAFLLPDLMFNMLVGGAIAAALIPVLSGYLEKNDEEDGWKAIGTFINVTIILMIIISLLGIIFAPQLVPIIAASRKMGHASDLAVKLTRILFSSVSFLMLAGLCNGILNSYRRFAASAYGPSIYNIFTALSIYFLSSDNPDNNYNVERVAYGVALSAFAYFVFQFSFVLKNLKYYRFKFNIRHPGFQKLYRLAIPSLLASSIVQVNIIISAGFVTRFASGSLTAFKMADTIWQLPYGIFAQGMGIAMLPTLSARLAVGEDNGFKHALTKGLRSVLMLSIPSAFAFIVLGQPIVRGIYKVRIGFDDSNITLVSGILVFFSIALITQSIAAIMGRAFYAANDTKTPLFIGLTTILINLAASYLFLTGTSLGVAGMALSYSLASLVNAILLIVIFNKKIRILYENKLLISIFKFAIASMVMSMVIYLIEKGFPSELGSAVFSPGTKILQLAALALEIVAGMVVYFGMLLILKSEEAIDTYALIKGRIKRIIKI